MDAPTPPRFCAPVQRWFTERFAGATEAQRGGWSAIGRGQDTLIMAPTGSGKTLAAFLAGIDTLVRRALEDRLEEGVKIVYISPLKALGADVERNLQARCAASRPPPPRWACPSRRSAAPCARATRARASAPA